jgi:hypothetical protein
MSSILIINIKENAPIERQKQLLVDIDSLIKEKYTDIVKANF